MRRTCILVLLSLVLAASVQQVAFGEYTAVKPETEIGHNVSLRDIETRALSGTITKAINDYYDAYISWSATQNKANLQSTVSVDFYIKKTSASSYRAWNNYGAIVTIKIDGSSVHSANHTFDFPANCEVGTKVSMGSGSKTVTHNADGTKSVSISASFASGISWGTVSVSGTATLNDIPVSVKVTYNANGGSVSTASKRVTYGKTYGTLATPTRTGVHLFRVVHSK